jgi:hypothetical protein
MVSFNYKSKRIGNMKNSFKKYPIKEVYKNVNTLANEVLPNNNSCVSSKTIKNCSGETRLAFCNGRIFRKPLAGYRKNTQTDSCTVKLQEIYKDPYAKSCGTSVCYDNRIRGINNKNGVKNTDYNYDYRQYLRKKCKSFDQFQRGTLDANGNFKSTCCDTDNNCATQKLRNKKYHKNQAVSSSSRLTRLKYNTILSSQSKNCQNGKVCGIYTSNTRYTNKNLEPNLLDTKNVTPKIQCKRRRIGGVLRTCYR